MRSKYLEKLLVNIDHLEPSNLNNLVTRLVGERQVFEAIFDTILDGVMLLNFEGTVEYANQSALRIMGLTEKDLGEHVIWKWLPDLLPYFKGEGSNLRLNLSELEISYPEQRVLNVYLIPVEQEDALEVHGIRSVLVLSDITQEKEKTDAMIEEEKLSSIFMLASGVAHEIGNPLNSISIQLQLMERALRKEDLLVEKLQESVKACLNEVSRLDGIVENFLKAMKPTIPELQPTRVMEVLEGVLEVLSHEMSNRGVAVEVELNPGLPRIRGDGNLLKQAFFNIVKNAMEAMPQGGELRIKTESDGQHVTLYFQDSGEGIKEEDLMRVFEPYHSTKSGGHGLGMVVTQKIVRSHGGNIAVQSEEGEGTCVTVTLPLNHQRFKMLTADGE